MVVSEISSLALIVHSLPYRQRSARADIDLALAATAMDIHLEVYFVGASLLQIIDDKNSKPALLPAGYRAWGALADLGDANLFAETDWLAKFSQPEYKFLAHP